MALDLEDRKDELVRAMARAVAIREQIRKNRAGLQKKASDVVDHASHAAKVAGESLAAKDNPLVYRYARARHSEAAQARAVALRAEGAPDDKAGR